MSRGSRLVLLALLVGLFGLYTQVAQAINVVVTGDTTPWDQTINPTFTFGSGVPDAPAIVTNSNLSFTAGNALLIQVLSGSVSAFAPDYPFVDANGNVVTPGNDPNAFVGAVNDGLGSSGNGFPSRYMGPYPPDINLMELVATFADSSGKIVGTPFFVGSSRTRIVPVGATQLQLGINDDIYDNNAGSFLVSVTNVPEPEGWLIMLSGIGLLCFVFRGRTRAG